MSAFSNYNSLARQKKRLIWLGYVAYSAYIWLFGGFDDFIENITPTDNPFVLLSVAFGLYWGVVLLVLWTLDN